MPSSFLNAHHPAGTLIIPYLYHVSPKIFSYIFPYNLPYYVKYADYLSNDSYTIFYTPMMNNLMEKTKNSSLSPQLPKGHPKPDVPV
jgi:hypothetical protein